jgi:triphosphatase
MFGTELKFQVPPPRRAALLRALKTATSTQSRQPSSDIGQSRALGLQVEIETDVLRTQRLYRCGHAIVALALDVGEMRVGGRTLPLCELRIALVSGPSAGLFALARRWAERHGLWLDMRSPAQRSELQQRGSVIAAATRALPPLLEPRLGSDAALRRMVAACLTQILPNLAALAAEAGTAEHLHQARIGLRRLRTALRLFGTWSAAVNPGWNGELAELFAELGKRRDTDALASTLLPELREAGAPWLELPTADSDASLARALREAPQRLVLLDLLAFAGEIPERAPASAKPVKRLAAAVIARLQRRLSRQAMDFNDLDDAARHRLRRRIKRLRYGIELVSALLPVKRAARQLAALRPAQEALGRYNDLCVAQALFHSQLEQEPRAWFALGWLAARRSDQQTAAAKALETAFPVLDL